MNSPWRRRVIAPRGLSSPGYDGDDPLVTPRSVAKPWLTWGNQQTLTYDTSGETFQANTTQILKANYEMPTTWTFLFVVDFYMAHGETAPVDCSYALTLGVGQASVTLQFSAEVFPSEDVYEQLVSQQVVPAEAVQCTAGISFNPVAIGSPSTFIITTLLAPRVM
jgi:hypothetical protein